MNEGIINEKDALYRVGENLCKHHMLMDLDCLHPHFNGSKGIFIAKSITLWVDLNLNCPSKLKDKSSIQGRE